MKPFLIFFLKITDTKQTGQTRLSGGPNDRSRDPIQVLICKINYLMEKQVDVKFYILYHGGIRVTINANQGLDADRLDKLTWLLTTDPEAAEYARITA